MVEEALFTVCHTRLTTLSSRHPGPGTWGTSAWDEPYGPELAEAATAILGRLTIFRSQDRGGGHL